MENAETFRTDELGIEAACLRDSADEIDYLREDSKTHAHNSMIYFERLQASHKEELYRLQTKNEKLEDQCEDWIQNCDILLSQLDWICSMTNFYLEGEDAALVNAIRAKFKTRHADLDTINAGRGPISNKKFTDSLYDDIYRQMDGHTIQSCILSMTKIKGDVRKFKSVYILTTIYGDRRPEVKYVVSWNSGKNVVETYDLAYAIALYVEG